MRGGGAQICGKGQSREGPQWAECRQKDDGD